LFFVLFMECVRKHANPSGTYDFTKSGLCVCTVIVLSLWF